MSLFNDLLINAKCYSITQPKLGFLTFDITKSINNVFSKLQGIINRFSRLQEGLNRLTNVIYLPN